MAGPPSSSAPERAVASAGSLRYRWSRGSSDQIEHWTARHCSRHEFGVELPQLVTAGAAPVLHGGIELADVLAAPADVDHQVVEGLAEGTELGGLLDLDAVEQRVDHVLGLACHPLRGGLDIVGELDLGVDDRRLGQECGGRGAGAQDKEEGGVGYRACVSER